MKTHWAIMMITAVLGLTLIGLLSGCQTTGQAQVPWAAGDAGPLTDSHGRARSLVFDSRQMRKALARMPLSESIPWYVTRNDARLATSAGIRSSTAERAVTVSRDSQRSFDGRIYNSNTRTTYHSRSTRAIR